jgi:hypothetical protein
MSRRSHENPDLYGEPVDDYAREQQAAYDDQWGVLDPPWWENR